MPEKEGENIVSEQQKKAQQEPDLNQLRKVRREKLADLQANGKDPFVITKYDQTHHSLEIQQKKAQQEPDLNQLRKVRREKLADLQANGKDPFVITKYDQTHHSLEIKENFEELAGKEVSIAGRMMSKRVMGKASFCNVQDLQKYDQTHHSLEIKENFEELAGKEVSIAGRMMSKRVMGKASFCNVQDLQGNIQSYVARDSIGEEAYKEFKKMDVGDVIGITGEVFETKTGEKSIHAGNIQSYVARDSIGEEAYKEFKKMDVGDVIGITGEVFETKTGEKSIHASSVTLLSKSLQILPEKFHGLTNTDIRYRQRYVDLIMNPDVKQTFINRSKILSAIRRYLDGQGFLEVETPMLVSNAGGAAARPFETHFNALDEDFKLRISLELYLKRLIVGGMERVYEIGRVFRNEGLDTRHNPEFTLMELYQAYTDYNGMMDLTENLYRHVAQEVLGTTVIEYNGVQMDLGKPFERITMVDAVKKYAGVDWNEVETLEQARELAKEHHVEFEERHKKGRLRESQW